MDDSKFLVLIRFDIESFCYEKDKRRHGKYPGDLGCRLYPGNRALFDQTEVIRRLVEILDKHEAKGLFVVTYDILKNKPEMLHPVLDSAGGHELTWHFHPRWDLQFEEDWGEPLESCFMAHYEGERLNRMLDMLETAFLRAYGFKPRICATGFLSTSTRFMNTLDKRGYLVTQNYTPNADLRHAETDNFDFQGRDPIPGGPEAPFYPYASNNIYRPNRHDGMLLGDMNLVEIPISQGLLSEMGKEQDLALLNPDLCIEGIKCLYNRKHELSTLLLSSHTCYYLICGPNPGDIDVKKLGALDGVLDYIDTLNDTQYCTALQAREEYLRWEAQSGSGLPRVRDVLNGVLFYDGVQAIKYNSIGFVGDSLETIAQENGIAQWLVDGLLIGPLAEPRIGHEVVVRPSIITAEVLLANKAEKLYEKNVSYSYKKEGNNLNINTEYKTAGYKSKNIYTIQGDDKTITLTTHIDVHGVIVHRINFHPDFNEIKVTKHGKILIENRKRNMKISVDTNADKISSAKGQYYTTLRLFFYGINDPYRPRHAIPETICNVE